MGWFSKVAARRSRPRFVPVVEAGGLESRALMSTLPAGFNDSVVATELVRPTSMDIAPDGRIFVCEQDGRLRIIDREGNLLPKPFLTFTVATEMERGLVGVVLDPNFARNQYVYVYRTMVGNPLPFNRLSRFTARGDVGDPNSEKILLDVQPTSALSNAIHNGGSMHFGKDGKLYIGVGDHFIPASDAQSLKNLKGKLLRINKDGSIPKDNPFYRQAKGKNRAIYALGFRNPFTFAIQKRTGMILVNDVQLNDFEEINKVRPGANYGWPVLSNGRSKPGYSAAFYTYRHGDGINKGCAITGGTFYDPARAQFPKQYQGQYFFADFCNGWIKRISPFTGRVTTFAQQVDPFIVDLDVGPEGALYYLSRGEWGYGAYKSLGAIHKIQYLPSSPPSIAQPPRDKLGSVNSTATFNVSPVGTEPFRFQWQRNGQDIPGATDSSYTTPPLTLQDSGAWFRVRVTNGFGVVDSRAATLSVTEAQPPIVSLFGPPHGFRYRPGEYVGYSGDALAGDGSVLPDSAFVWQVDLHHDEHFHPVVPPTRGVRRGSFLVEAHTNAHHISYLISLTVTDPATGISTTVTREIFPA